MPPHPQWPAFVHFDGMDELSWIASEQDWQQFRAQTAGRDAQDRLIDRCGQVFPLSAANLQLPQPGRISDTLTLDAFNELIRRHASQGNECCIGKLAGASHDEAMSILASLIDD